MSNDEYALSVSVLDNDNEVEFEDAQVAVGPDDSIADNNVDNMSDTQLLAEVAHLQDEGSVDIAQGAVHSEPEDAVASSEAEPPSQRMLQDTKKRKRRLDASYAFKLHCLVELKKDRAASESVYAIAKVWVSLTAGCDHPG